MSKKKNKKMDTDKAIEKLAKDVVEVGEQDKEISGIKEMVKESLEDVAKVTELTDEAADTLKTLQEETTVTVDREDIVTVGEDASKPRETNYSVQVGPKDPLVLEIEAKEAAKAAEKALEPAPEVDTEEVLNKAYDNLKGGMFIKIDSSSIQIGETISIKIGNTLFKDVFVIKNELKANELTGTFDSNITIKDNGRIKEFNIGQTVEILK